MDNLKHGKLIRTGSHEILSCTITECNSKSKSLDFLDINFREAVEKRCGVLFYEYKGEYYYPISMEFRLIDNNVLFLLNELKIDRFDHLALLLTSSFKREEERDVSFFAVIYELNEIPKLSIKIPSLVFCENDEVIRVKHE
jgi:hypothetical protein